MARAARQIRLSGVFPSAITPHHAKTREADFAGALELIDFLANGGADGICLFGATGEFLNYSFDERQRLLSLSVKRSRVPVVADISHSTLSDALQLADGAISAGADALKLMPPCFFRYEQGEVEQFFRLFARETRDAVPMLISNVPAFTTGMEFETIRRLLETGRFAAVEEASGDWTLLEKLLDLKNQMPFALLCGSEALSARALRAGADGIISGCACAIPEVAAGLASAVASGDAERAAQFEALFLEFAERAAQFPWPVAVRRATELRGQKSGPCSVPLSPEKEKALGDFAGWFQRSNFANMRKP